MTTANFELVDSSRINVNQPSSGNSFGLGFPKCNTPNASPQLDFIHRQTHFFNMSESNQANGYQAKGEGTFFDDGREIELLHFIYNKPDLEEIRDSPKRVLAAIDEYARKTKYLMNVGEQKGKIVSDLIAEVKPQTMVGSGLFCLVSTC